MHRFMLDSGTRTDYEGIWFTHGPVVICDDEDGVETFANMAALQQAHPTLELRWLDNAAEYWDAEDLAVRSALSGWTYQGPEFTLPAPPLCAN